MLARQRRDQLLDDDRLADAGAAEHAGLAALGERRDQVDHLDAGLEHLGAGHLVGERGRRTVDRVVLGGLHGTAVVHRLADHVEDPSQGRLAHGHGDGGAGVDHPLAAAQAVGGVHGHRAHHRAGEVLLHLQHQPGVVRARRHDLQGVADLGQVLGGKLHVHHRSHHLHHAAVGGTRTVSVCHCFLSLAQRAAASASAPPAMSSISSVIDCWRALL